MRIILLLLTICCVCMSCLEPVTTGLAAAAISAALSAGYWKGVCFFKECCTDRWTRHNVTELLKTLDAELFGQHLVKNIVQKAVAAHVLNQDPKKALVLSFHGWTGSGKNHVADIISKHVFKEGTNSKYVHKIISTHEYPDSGNLNDYKDSLKIFLETKTKKCERSMFIFDEMDKMPSGLSDVLKPFMDYHTSVNGLDYRKNIFIFLSNTAGDRINNETVKHFNSGKAREFLTSKQMERILSIGAFNIDGGFKGSELILSGLVDFFIPFLPMERKHVMQCAEAAIKRRNKPVHKEVLEQVADELQYFPKGLNIYSTTGCKQVEKKVDGFL